MSQTEKHFEQFAGGKYLVPLQLTIENGFIEKGLYQRTQKISDYIEKLGIILQKQCNKN